ncbi:MAG: DUF1501 domain-containing protein [bacterium]|nr:DUF1501 domain-containing protein [bacterium]
MSEHKCKGCAEYRDLSRRQFVGLSAGLVAATVAPSWLPRVAYAQADDSARDVMVSIFLRGGVDSLSMCVPFTEPAYYDLRPTIAVAPPDSGSGVPALDLDGRFGFPPTMAALMDAFTDGELLVVHACGLPESNRSHFDAMHFMEVGDADPPPSVFTGWLGRHLAATAPTLRDGVLRAVGIGFGLQRTLVGAPKALPISDLADFGFEGSGATRRERKVVLEEIYKYATEPLKTSASDTFRTVDTLKKIGFTKYKPKGGARYPDSEFGYAMRSVAALIKGDVGVEAVALDLDGWDTHDFQGNLDGSMMYLLQDLADSLAAFYRDMKASNARNVVTVAMSEFGRNVFENGSQGTDHGHGGLMLAMGSSINGGQVLTNWPGLGANDLFEDQDLQITIDYRDILTEILTRRMGNSDFRKVFQDSGYTPKTHGAVV